MESGPLVLLSLKTRLRPHNATGTSYDLQTRAALGCPACHYDSHVHDRLALLIRIDLIRAYKL